MRRISAQITRAFTGHKGPVYAMAASHIPGQFYSAGSDGIVAQWDAGSGEGIAVMNCGEAVYTLLSLPEIPALVAGTLSGNLIVLHLISRERHNYNPANKPVYALSRGDAEGTFCTGTGAGGYFEFTAFPFRQTAAIQLGSENVRSIVTGGQYLYAGCSDGRIYELHKQEVVHSIPAHRLSAFSLLHHPTENILFSGGRDAAIRKWKLDGALQLLAEVAAHTWAVNDLAFLPMQNLLISASRDKTVKIWDTQDLVLLKVLDHPRNNGHTHSVNRLLAFEGHVLSAGDDGKVLKWEIDH